MRTCFIISAIKTTIAIRSTHFYRPQTKLREGNVFTAVCWSLCSRWGPASWGVSPSGSEGMCLPLGLGVYTLTESPWTHTPPPGHTHNPDTPPGHTHTHPGHIHPSNTYTPPTQTPQHTHPGHPLWTPRIREMAIEAVTNQDVHNAELLV